MYLANAVNPARHKAKRRGAEFVDVGAATPTAARAVLIVGVRANTGHLSTRFQAVGCAEFGTHTLASLASNGNTMIH